MPAQDSASSEPTPSGPAAHVKLPCGIGFLLLALLAVSLLSGCVSSGTSSTQPTTTTQPPTSVSQGANALQQQVINVIHTVQPSVVEIEGFNGGDESIGSGNILTSDGYIVTNDHVVHGSTSFTVRIGTNQVVPAKLIGEAAQDDLAVLRVNVKNLPPISFGDSSKVQVGQFVVAIGSPLGLEETATIGIVSALNRAASEGAGGAPTLVGLIQTSAPINPGNSGGALVDLSGQLIGIPTLAAVDPEINAPANGIGFAIPSNRVQFVTQQLMKYGKLTSSGQGFLGIEGQEVTPQVAAANGLSVQSGVLVAGFAKDASGKSPAQQAGLRLGDSIVAINNQAVASSTDLASLTLTQQPGTKISLTVARGTHQQTIQVTLGERPVGS